MKGLLIYFSATGNTKFIAKCIQREFFDKGDYIQLKSIEDISNITLDNYDFLILGSPKHYEYIPKFFIDWIKKTLPLSSKPINTILYCTGVSPTITSFDYLIKVLRKKNCNVVITKTFQMPSNYLIGMYKQTSDYNTIQYSLQSNENAKDLVQKFKLGIYNIEHVGSFIAFMCKNISSYYFKKSGRRGRNLSINGQCDNCLKCVRNCPTNNIHIEDKHILFKDKCIMCTRCINSCPQNAILYKNKIPKQYKYHLNEISFK